MRNLNDSAREVIEMELASIEKRIASHKRILTTLQDKHDGLSMTLRHFAPKESVIKKTRASELLNVTTDELRGMGIEEALVLIARKNTGLVSSGPARKLLEDAGVLKGSQTSNRLWQVFQESERFEQVRRGQYKLKHHVPF